MFRCCLHDSQKQLNIIQVGSPLNGSCTLVQSLFSEASTRHGLSLSSAWFAILSSGVRAFVALTDGSQGGLLNKVFGPRTHPHALSNWKSDY